MMPPHGTRSRYEWDGCRCIDCRAANAAYYQEWCQRPRDPADLRHGEASTYRNYACRCVPCREANTQKCRDYRLRQAAS
jgi:hypothetical protein